MTGFYHRYRPGFVSSIMMTDRRVSYFFLEEPDTLLEAPWYDQVQALAIAELLNGHVKPIHAAYALTVVFIGISILLSHCVHKLTSKNSPVELRV